MNALFRRLSDQDEIELVRDYDKPIDKVWAALTTPARIEAWMGVEWLSDKDAPLKLGGAFEYRFGNTGIGTKGRVVQFQAPRLFEHSWHEDTSYASIVAWRLDPTDGGCRLTLTHRLKTREDAPRTAAGWTMLTGQLQAWLDGETFQPEQSWRQARDDYAEQFVPEATLDARLVQTEGEQTLRFERIVHRPIDKVWAALTTPAGFKAWLQATVEIEPRASGRIHITFHSGGDHKMLGEVLAFDAPYLFEFTWTEVVAGQDSVVRFELEPLSAETCRLVLIHRLPDTKEVADFASGWHWHMDGVEAAAADGVETAWDVDRWRVLKQMYEATLPL